MKWHDYESVFYPVGHESNNTGQDLLDLISLPTPELLKKYEEYEEYLERHRRREPPRKRSKKSDYRIWVQLTQNYIEILNGIAEELESRDDYDPKLTSKREKNTIEPRK